MNIVADPADKVASTPEPNDAQQEYQEETRRLRARTRLNAQVARAELPGRWAKLDATTVQPRDGQQAAHATVRAWALGRLSKPGLLLNGDTGRGKTHTAAFACHLYLTASPTNEAKWVDVSDYLAALNADFGDPKRDQALRLANIETNRTVALFLDDLDAHKLSETQVDWLYRVVKRWEAEGWPVIATSHRDYSQLLTRLTPKGKNEAGKLAQALVSRLTAMCMPVSVTGPDHRSGA